MAASTGIREALVYAEVAGKKVTVLAGGAYFTGTVLSVNPLVVEPGGGECARLVNFDMVAAVCLHETPGKELLREVRPKGEARMDVKAW